VNQKIYEIYEKIQNKDITPDDANTPLTLCKDENTLIHMDVK
jgi:hypothetical protein